MSGAAVAARELADAAFRRGRDLPPNSDLRTNAYLAAIYHRLTAIDLAGGGGSGGVAADPAPVVPSTPKPTKKAAPARKRATPSKRTSTKETS